MSIEHDDDYIPLEKRFPGLLQDLDESIKDSVSGMGDEEATFYAVTNIVKIEDLKERFNNLNSI